MEDNKNAATEAENSANNTSKTKEPNTSTQPNTIPYERFQQVVAEKNGLKERLEGFEKSLATLLSSDKTSVTSKDVKHLTPQDIEKIIKAQFDEVKRQNAEEKLLDSFSVLSEKMGAHDFKALTPFIPSDIMEAITKGDTTIQGKFEATIQEIKKAKPFLFKEGEEGSNNPYSAPTSLFSYVKSEQAPPKMSTREKLLDVLTHRTVPARKLF